MPILIFLLMLASCAAPCEVTRMVGPWAMCDAEKLASDADIRLITSTFECGAFTPGFIKIVDNNWKNPDTRYGEYHPNSNMIVACVNEKVYGCSLVEVLVHELAHAAQLEEEDFVDFEHADGFYWGDEGCVNRTIGELEIILE